MPSPVARYALDNGFPRDLIFTPERAGEVYALWQKFYAILDGTFSLPVHCVLCFTLKGFNKYWFFLKKIVWFFIIVIICHSVYVIGNLFMNTLVYSTGVMPLPRTIHDLYSWLLPHASKPLFQFITLYRCLKSDQRNQWRGKSIH